MFRPGESGLLCDRTPANKQILQSSRLKSHQKEWESITSDKVILDIVEGYKINFTTVPHQHCQPKQPTFEENEEIALSKALKNYY